MWLFLFLSSTIYEYEVKSSYEIEGQSKAIMSSSSSKDCTIKVTLEVVFLRKVMVY
jgi:hypothetical protein